MIESLDDSREELKRVDHLIYVSLKYTRTVDVLLNIIKRLIDAYDFAIEALLRYAQDEKIIIEMPTNALAKTEMLLSKFEDQIIRENLELYMLFKKISKAQDIERLREFRRHVTLKTIIDNKDIEINIDNITEYYSIIKEFVQYIDNLISENDS